MDDDNKTPDSNAREDDQQARIIDLSDARKKREDSKTGQGGGKSFVPKSWNITYKSDKWGSGNGEKVSPNSQGNSGFVKGGHQSGRGGDSQPFFNFSALQVFTRFLLIAFVFVHVLLHVILPEEQAAPVQKIFAFIPMLWAQGAVAEFSFLSFLSPVTYMFLHADWMHLFFNAIMTVAFGAMVERSYGARTMAKLFFTGGLVGAAAFFVMSMQVPATLIGASAGLSALFGAGILMISRQARQIAGAPAISVKVIVGIWLGVMVVTGLLAKDVAWVSHVAGFLTGLAYSEAMRRGYIKP